MNIKTLSWRTFANYIFISGQVNNFISLLFYTFTCLWSRGRNHHHQLETPFHWRTPWISRWRPQFSLKTPHIFIGDAPDFHRGLFSFVGDPIFSLETPRLLLNTQWKGFSNCTPMMMISSQTRFYGRLTELIINISQKKMLNKRWEKSSCL